jgi:hypothetical protein
MILVFIDFRDFSAFTNPSHSCTIVYLVEGTSLFRILSSAECNDHASALGMAESVAKDLYDGSKVLMVISLETTLNLFFPLKRLLHYTMLSVLHCIRHDWTVQRCVVLYCAALHCTILYRTVPRVGILRCPR